MTLYEIKDDIEEINRMIEEGEASVEALADTLEGLEGELNDKVDCWVKAIRSYRADADTLKAEKMRLAARQTSLEKRAENMRNTLALVLDRLGKKKVKTAFATVSVGKDKLVIDTKAVPDEFKVEVTKLETDKDKVIAALDEGNELAFAHYEKSITIR